MMAAGDDRLVGGCCSTLADFEPDLAFLFLCDCSTINLASSALHLSWNSRFFFSASFLSLICVARSSCTWAEAEGLATTARGPNVEHWHRCRATLQIRRHLRPSLLQQRSLLSAFLAWPEQLSFDSPVLRNLDYLSSL